MMKKSSNKALVTPGSTFLRKYLEPCIRLCKCLINYFECDSREINDCVLSLLSCL